MKDALIFLAFLLTWLLMMDIGENLHNDVMSIKRDLKESLITNQTHVIHQELIELFRTPE